MNAIGVEPVRGGRLSIAVGQVPLTIHFSQSEMRHRAEERYAAFRVREDGIPIFLEPETKPVPRSPGLFTYRLHRLNHTSTLCLNSAAYFCGVRHEFGLDSLMRVLLTVLLLPRRGFLLHAATVVRDGRAHVFMGRSGAGKSTVAALSPPGSVLTDEISLLRFHGGEWRAHGTPFWGEFRAEGSNVHFPLAGIYALTQSGENRVERLRAKESLRAVLPNILFFCSRKRETDQLFEIVSQAIIQIPFYRLFFVRQPSFWEAIV